MMRENKGNNRLTAFALVAMAAVLLWPFGFISAQSITDPSSSSNVNSSTSGPGGATSTADPTVVADLNQQIANQKAIIDALNAKAKQYQDQIDAAQGQVKDLRGQVAIIDNQITQTNVAIEAKQEEIRALELEIASIQQQIDAKTTAINGQREQLASDIVRLDQNSRTSTLALVLTHGSLAEFYGQAQATAALGESLKDSIGQLHQLRSELEAKQGEISQARDQVTHDKAQLESQKQATEDQRTAKDYLLGNVQQSADQYNQLLRESLQQEQQADAAINGLEAQLRKQLGSDNPQFTSTGFVWPLAVTKGISTYFHDTNYPFNFLYCSGGLTPPTCGHPGIDIPAPQGTPVRATADGVVSAIANQGFATISVTCASGKTCVAKKSVLNYVSLVHDNGMSSRYLHLSVVYVNPEQFVKQGDIIGLSGGLPGTAGAGGYTTGAHLHFELRVGGLPDDPLKYLP